MPFSKPNLTFSTECTVIAPVALNLDRQRIDQGVISGYAALWSQGFTPGFFKASLAYHAACGTVPALTWNSNPADIVGRIVNVREDDRGLYVTGQIALSTERGGILRQELLAGIDGLSALYSMQTGIGGSAAEAHVFEISAMREATIQTSTGANARAPEFSNSVELERFLRDNGVAKNAAKKIAAGGWQRLKSDDTDTLDKQTEKELSRALADANFTLSTFQWR